MYVYHVMGSLDIIYQYKKGSIELLITVGINPPGDRKATVGGHLIHISHPSTCIMGCGDPPAWVMQFCHTDSVTCLTYI